MQAKFVTVKFQLESKSKGGKSKSGYSRVSRGLVTKKGQVFCTEDSRSCQDGGDRLTLWLTGKGGASFPPGKLDYPKVGMYGVC